MESAAQSRAQEGIAVTFVSRAARFTASSSGNPLAQLAHRRKPKKQARVCGVQGGAGALKDISLTPAGLVQTAEPKEMGARPRARPHAASSQGTLTFPIG